MYTAKLWNCGPLTPEKPPREYTFNQIKDIYKRQGWGIENLLKYGYYLELGWTYNFRDKGELKHYLYDSSVGTGKAWAPNVKLLEKALGHKVYRAFALNE